MIAPRQEAGGESVRALVLQLHLEDTLASVDRLWVRGRVVGLNRQPNGGAVATRWWKRRRHHGEPLPPLQLETRVSGTAVQTEVVLSPDGGFEATLTGDLPPARRGWRVARYQASYAGCTAEACGLILTPPAAALGAVVVSLPLHYTLQGGGAQAFARAESLCRLKRLLRTLAQSRRGSHPIYYLVGVPQGDASPAEWALAATALGWPAGHVVVLPVETERAQEALLLGIDRLGWLFADSLELLVLNLEPSIAHGLAARLEPAPDRALVRHLINPEEDPWKVLGQEAWITGLRPTRSSLLPRYPIVFCHGMLAFSTLKMRLPEDLNCFAPLRDFLRQRGFRVLLPQVAPTSGVAERAAQLKKQILEWTDEPVNLVAHSMGGLDCRYMVTHLGMAERVRSLTTVSTSHRGTYLADWFIANFRNRVPLLLAMEAFGLNMDGFRDCRLDACREFNAKTPDRPEVRYFSYGGEVPQSRVSPVLRRAWNLLTPIEGPNDGMVSRASARWGEYLGTVHADHFAQTPDAVFLRAGEDFDCVGFYCRLVENLARRGF